MHIWNQIVSCQPEAKKNETLESIYRQMCDANKPIAGADSKVGLIFGRISMR